MVGLRLPCQIKYLHQCRDAHAIHSALLRKGRGVGRARLQASDVIALQLRQCERTDRGPLGGEKRAVRSARVVGVETAVVADDENPIAGHGEIELERGHAARERRREGRQRVFRRQTAGAAMACRSNAPAAEHRTTLTTTIAAAMIFFTGNAPLRRAPQPRAADATTTARTYCDAVTSREWRWRLARSGPARSKTSAGM